MDGCCDHCEMVPDEELHRHAAENLAQVDALLFGRVTYNLMEEPGGSRRAREQGLNGWPTGWHPSRE